MSKGKAIGIVLVIAIVAIGIVAWHDGLFGVTQIRDINQGDIDVGTAVTIKGELTARLGNLVTVNTGSNFVAFLWEGEIPPLHSIVVVRGTVESFISLTDVTSVDAVWIFQ